MDVDRILAELLVVSVFNIFSHFLLAGVTIFVIVPYLFGIVPLYAASAVTMIVTFILGVSAIYMIAESVSRSRNI